MFQDESFALKTIEIETAFPRNKQILEKTREKLTFSSKENKLPFYSIAQRFINNRSVQNDF